MSIDELELSVRSYNCLKRAGINTVEELTNKTSEDMMKVRNLSDALTTPSPSYSMYAVLGSLVSLLFFIARLLMFMIISVTSSFTPGMVTITRGRGYVSSERNKTEDLPIGVIAVDSIYTPVERVNVTVENTRVGQITDFDKLTLDVYTNGTLEPDEAVSLAAKVLSEHLNLFIDLSENAKTAEVMVEKEDDEKEKVLEMSAGLLSCCAQNSHSLCLW